MKDLTIIIPTHFRHQYLSRILEYFKGSNYAIIILDSTDVKFSSEEIIEESIVYHYVPELKLIPKLVYGLTKVKTKYCLFCADDDFISPNGIQACLQFLECNPGYTSAQGRYVGFPEISKEGKIPIKKIYQKYTYDDYNGGSGIERALQLAQEYRPLSYAVHNTTDLLEVYNIIDVYGIENYYLMELISCFMPIIRGKHMVLPMFYSAREIVETPNYKMDSAYSVFKEGKNPKELKAFIEILSNELVVQESVDKDTAVAEVNRIINVYCEKRNTSVPIVNRNIFQKIVNRLYYKWVYKDEKPQNYFNKPSKLSGYELDEDWLAMEKLIAKYKVN